MSSLQPIHALNLDSVQQQSFIKFFNSLPEKPATTVRIFDRNDYYSVHGTDATTAAKEVFSSESNIKKMGIKPNQLDYLVLSKGNFETLVKKLLLVRRYRIEIYVSEGSVKSSEWVVKYKGSPGCFSQMEDVLGEGLGESNETPPALIAVNIKNDRVTKGRLVGVACVTPSEYEVSVSEFTDDDLLTHLETIVVQLAPTECLIPQTDNEDCKALKKIMERANITLTKLKKSEFSTEGLIQDLNRLLKFKEGQQNDANAYEETRQECAMTSLAAAVKYMSLMSDNTNFGRYRLSTISADCFVLVDGAALSALNVFPELGDCTRSHTRSLYGLLDRCRTTHGRRLLAQWLRQPLRDINLINERLDVVEVLVNKSQLRLQLHEDHMRRVPDLQALARRLTRKKANLQDCYRIYQAIVRLPSLLHCLSEAENSTVHSSLTEPIAELLDDLAKFRMMIETTLDMEAVERGDFLVKPSFDEELQSLHKQLEQLQSAAEKELRKAANDLDLEAGKTVKLENNTQHGFYFRVTLKEEQNLRGNKRYTIIDAVKGGVRFKTDALETITEDYTQVKTNYEKEQDKVVAEIVGIAAGYSECLFCLSHILSRLDVLLSFAMSSCAAPYPYCRPTVVEDITEFRLDKVRHPCLELQEGVSYIPNDVFFHRDKYIMHIVTGANMGGKSTWMRSAGVAALLAHAGCFVPCQSAKLPLLRSICARVGASDKEQQGQSTFMREMIESAAILRTATADSLVLIDELGRGTSTYEGCGLAWAIAEELAMASKCFCLFATHYHELTRLPRLHPGLVTNSHAAASLADNELVLLHEIRPGPATKSLGLHIAALANLPESCIKYAEEKQSQLETDLFESEKDETSSDTVKGKEMIVEFLMKCKELVSDDLPDEERMDRVATLKKQFLNSGNMYVQSLLLSFKKLTGCKD